MSTLEERLVEYHLKNIQSRFEQFIANKKGIFQSDFIPMNLEEYITLQLSFDKGGKDINITNSTTKKKLKISRINGIMLNKGKALFPLDMIIREAKKRGSKPLCLLEEVKDS